jgi:hypothetical protein
LKKEIEMLKGYEGLIENGQIKWLKEQPNIKSARAILTFLEEDVLIIEKADVVVDADPKLKSLGGSEPQTQDIPHQRHEIVRFICY